MIFDEEERTDDSPMSRTEGDFAFLNRSARPEMQRVRDFLEMVLAEYEDEEDQKELIARLRSGDFHPAAFETILHGALIRLGYKVSCHPEVPDSEGRPDFKVEAADGSHFIYVEASATSIRDGRDEGAETRKAVVYEAIERVENRSFFLDISSSGDPATSPRIKRLRSELGRWLSGLDPDALRKEIAEHGHERAPRFTWEHDGLMLDITAFPKAAEKRTDDSRVIRSYGERGARSVDSWTPIRDRVMAKGNRYGKLDAPLIVAINTGSFTLDKIDVMQALFGQEVSILSGTEEPNMRREPNGAFLGPEGPRYTRISGVWVFNDINPYNITTRRHSVYLNPFAEHQCPDSVLDLPYHRVNEDNEMKFHQGFCLPCIFELEETWPE